MNNENLQKWALVAEIIGAAAVVISLIFVGLQINQSAEETAQNTRAIEANAYQELIAQISTLAILIAQDPDFAELYGRMMAGGSPANDAEAEQIEAFVTLSIRHGDLAFRQYQNGLIDANSLNSVLTPLVAFLALMEPAKPRWDTLKKALSPAYVDYVENMPQMGIGRNNPGSADQ